MEGKRFAKKSPMVKFKFTLENDGGVVESSGWYKEYSELTGKAMFRMLDSRKDGEKLFLHHKFEMEECDDPRNGEVL